MVFLGRAVTPLNFVNLDFTMKIFLWLPFLTSSYSHVIQKPDLTRAFDNSTLGFCDASNALHCHDHKALSPRSSINNCNEDKTRLVREIMLEAIYWSSICVRLLTQRPEMSPHSDLLRIHFGTVPTNERLSIMSRYVDIINELNRGDNGRISIYCGTRRTYLCGNTDRMAVSSHSRNILYLVSSSVSQLPSFRPLS